MDNIFSSFFNIKIMIEPILHYSLWYILTGIAIATIAFYKNEEISMTFKDKQHRSILLIGLFIFCVIAWVYIFLSTLPRMWIRE